MKKRLFSALCAVTLSLMVLVSCGSKNDTPKVELSDVCTAVRDAYGEDYVGVEQSEEMIEQVLKIDKDLYDEIYFEMPMISVQPDRFVAVKAKDGKGEEVEKKLNEYRDSLLQEGMQYPMNLPLAQASQVVRYGDYVFFVLLGEIPMDIIDSGDDAKMADSAKEQIQIGLDAIEKAVK